MSPSSSPANSQDFVGAVPDEWQMYRYLVLFLLSTMRVSLLPGSDSPGDYLIGEPIGYGASSTVYTATYIPPDYNAPLECAVKEVDLDKLPLKSLALLKRETQLMSLSKHPNVLRVRGTWMSGHHLYIAMRLMKSGSVADVMRARFSAGLGEDVCRAVLKQALEGLKCV
jgi:serine/threonine-protein kinase OSR1/STK39